MVCTVHVGSTLLVFFYLPGRLILVDSFLHVPFRVVVFHLLLPLSHYFTCCGHYRASLTVLHNSKIGTLPHALLEQEPMFYRRHLIIIKPSKVRIWMIMNCEKKKELKHSGRSDCGVSLRPFTCWDCGFEFHRRIGRLSLMIFECCHVQVSAPTDHTSRGTLPNVVRLSVIVRPRKGGPGPLRAVAMYGDGRVTKGTDHDVAVPYLYLTFKEEFGICNTRYNVHKHNSSDITQSVH